MYVYMESMGCDYLPPYYILHELSGPSTKTRATILKWYSWIEQLAYLID